MNINNNFYKILKTVFILIFIVSVSDSFSQNYKLIDTIRIRTYAELEKNYYFIKVDSIATEATDTIYYFNRIVDTIPQPDCDVFISDTALIGSKMIMKSDTDATHVFFNRNNDSIFIRTHINVADSWQLYKYSNGNYINAYVISILPLTILPDIIDTVIRIKLFVYTPLGVNLDTAFPNGTKIDITKNYGIIEFWPFYDFPNDTVVAILRGITNPDTAITDVTAYDAFNFLPGYEFHYKNIENTEDGRHTEKYYKYFVLDKFQYPDSVSYSMFRAEVDYISLSGGLPDTIITTDTIQLNYPYNDFSYLDTVPLSLLNSAYGSGYSVFHTDSLYTGIPYKDVLAWYAYNPATKCLNDIDSYHYPQQRFGEGAGRIHYLDSLSESEYHRIDLVYFQRGIYVWGTPLNFPDLGLVNINNISAGKINIYPNPAHDFIKISIPSDCLNKMDLFIYDVAGDEVFKQELYGRSDNTVNISHLANGLYFLHFSGCYINYTVKLVKSN